MSTVDIYSYKPLLRGKIHAFAFVCTAIAALFFLVSSILKHFNSGILIYIISQLLQYGASSFYHIPAWSPKVKNILRYLDHICIFIMISGTQTSVLLNTISATKSSAAALMIKLSWTFAILGILKIVLLKKLHNILDLVLYILQGCIILPFSKHLAEMQWIDKFLVGCGGILYLVGGVIYGIEKPNLHPKIFGYHELFHLLTVMANMCFGIIISRPYLISMFFSNYPHKVNLSP